MIVNRCVSCDDDDDDDDDDDGDSYDDGSNKYYLQAYLHDCLYIN